MRIDYDYDIFISFTHEDGKEVKTLYLRLIDFGLRVFWSEEKLKTGVAFTTEIQNALENSQQFVLYFTKKASKSKWVRQEWTTFYNNYHLKDEENRRMFVLRIEPCEEKEIPPLLSGINRPKTQLSLISDLVKMIYSKSEKELGEISATHKRDPTALKSQLENEIKKGSEARDYYRHNRFWRPITEERDVHIFTCARDVLYDPDNKRGQGGRTNIDMWDYRSVFDITHFFASNYPNTKVTIEDPVSKLGDDDLTEAHRLGNHISHMRRLLENKDCIIIGSPDVSDFAEIVLAELHSIPPYSKSREKTKGFVIVKEKKSRSSFYWEKKEDEEEGIAQLVKPNGFNIISHEVALEDGSTGKMFGILVVANNPFCTKARQSKIIILSGFSGVGTNAIAKILTSEECLEEFFRLDQAYQNIGRPIEALVGVKYMTADRNYSERDTRKIEDFKKDIFFEKLVEI